MSAALLLTPPAHTQEPESRTAGLDAQIDWLRLELAELEGEAASLSRDLDLLGTQEALSRRLHQRATARRREVIDEMAAEEERQEMLASALVRSRERAAAALREIYKQSSMAGYASVLAVSDPREVLRGLQSLDVVARRQREAVTDYAARKRESEATAKRLRALRDHLEATLKEAEREERRLAEARRSRLSLLEKVDMEREAHEQAMAELTRAALEMDRAISELSPGDDPPVVSIDFSKLKGTLPWPGPGPVLQPFGEVRHPRFGTVTPHPGWDVQAPPGGPVRVVAAGRVVFSRRFGGYGPTVVIDHGGRYLSVYARLAASTVREGADLLPGEQVGFSAEAHADGKSFFYFEIRHQGQAVDPAGWLRRTGGRESRS